MPDAPLLPFDKPEAIPVKKLPEGLPTHTDHKPFLKRLTKKMLMRNQPATVKSLLEENAMLEESQKNVKGQLEQKLVYMSQQSQIYSKMKRATSINRSKEKWISRMKPSESKQSHYIYKPREMNMITTQTFETPEIMPNFIVSKSPMISPSAGFLQLPLYHG